jgi:hypothetical protein
MEIRQWGQRQKKSWLEPGFSVKRNATAAKRGIPRLPNRQFSRILALELKIEREGPP